MTIDIEELRKDMEAGTQGDWVTFGWDNDGVRGKGIFSDEILSRKVETGYRDARRIARLPELEREYLALREAADALAEVSESCLRMMDDVIKGSGKGDMQIKPDGSLTVIDGWKRFAAYRKATG